MAGACLLLATAASGHPQYALSTVNRYGKLVVTGRGPLRLFYTLMVGDVPAMELRRQADKNGDGQLDANEQAGLSQQLNAEVAATLTIAQDGQPLAPRWEPPILSLQNPQVGPLAFACELSATLPALPHDHELLLRYEDRGTLQPIGEVELRIEESPDVRVLATWQGSAPPPRPTRELLYQTQGPPRSLVSDRSISLRVLIPSGIKKAPPPSSRLWLYALLPLLFAGGYLIYRLRQEHLFPGARRNADRVE